MVGRFRVVFHGPQSDGFSMLRTACSEDVRLGHAIGIRREGRRDSSVILVDDVLLMYSVARFGAYVHVFRAMPDNAVECGIHVG